MHSAPHASHRSDGRAGFAAAETKKATLRSLFSNQKFRMEPHGEFGAGNETRTRDPDLGKVVLYQLSYSRITCIKSGVP